VIPALLISATLAAALPSGAADAAGIAPLDLFVATDGSDVDNTCRTTLSPCRTLQHAVNVASGSTGAGRDVVIRIGPGTYLPRDGGVHVFAGSLTSLTIAGAGPAETVLHTPLPNSHEVVALTIAAGFTRPVRVESLRITGHGFDGQHGSGDVGSFVTGIKDAGSGLLQVTDVRIDRLRGGHGARGTTNGGDGGSVYGIDRDGGPTEIRRTTITELRGGDGAGARLAPGRHRGGEGGTAIGVNTDGALRVMAAVIGNLRGGAAGPGADGGSAYSAAVHGVTAATSAEFVDSELSGNTGGRGGPGLAGRRGAPGGQGGQGGAAVGVSYTGPQLVVTGSTLSGHQGARGGTGGTGGEPSSYLPAGAGGRGGDGGAAIGAVANSPDLIATTSFVNSTLSGNRAGVGGPGGNASPSGIGGDGGDGGAAAGAALLAGPTAGLTNSAVHVTAVGNLGAAGGAGGRAGAPGVPGKRSTTAAGLASNAPTTLAASLLDNGASEDCLLIDAPLVDGGWNLAADSSCFRAGAGSRVVPEVGAGLEALADNGGLTRTLAVPPNSPAATAVAVVSGLCSGPFATDQRGAPRPGRGGPHSCAAGAFEPA
jgi:hypothetical protein